jgi:cell division protein FtsI/penicillin-binding protein 2
VRVPDEAGAKARAALGEGTVLVTPAQLLLAYSAIATRGAVFRLWNTSSGKTNAPPLLRQVKLRSEVFEVLGEGLEECVRSGSGQGAAVEGERVAGKTGTATALNRPGVTHAWFVGYAPAKEPEIALVVFLERGTGARDAAPLAGKILQHFFASKGQKP